ncbi:Putative restriction endonuclease domain-containing protein [Tumidithrix helvetica PCC 7403]|uniref:Uma2 family endonuclease n=1 Tax=Tumidithrix helvetica TaxID=3457545 RepID=UPI003C91EAC8
MTISGNHKLTSKIELPDEDFEPMPEGDKQRRNLSYTTEALRLWFEKQQNVYVSGNLFIRYQEELAEKRVAPDLFVVFGMSNEDRVSYTIGKDDGKAPDFVLEVTSKGTVTKDREQNPLIYRALGVKEYFQYDPSGEYLKPASLQGVRLENGKYVAIAALTLPDGTLSLHSEVLGLDLHLYSDKKFRFYDPISNQILRSYAEAEQARYQAELERSQAELERSFEQQARREAEAAQQQAEAIANQERSIADRERSEKLQERLAKEQAEQKAQRLAERLIALGLDPDEIS